MAAGRRPDPPHLRAVKGDSRPSRQRQEGVAGSSDRPEAPDFLSATEAHEFREIVVRLEDIGLASASDVGVISLAARRAAEILTLSAEIEEHGFTYETMSESGRMIKANPAVRMRSEAMRHLHSLESNLGLTPLDRLRVPQKKKDGPVNAFAAKVTRGA